MLKGMNAALEGRRRVAAPPGWDQLRAALFGSDDADVRGQAQALAVVFGDSAAFEIMRKIVADPAAPVDERGRALQSLLAANDPPLGPILRDLVNDPALREPALAGLAAYDDPEAPGVVLAAYPSLDLSAKRVALNTLAGRPAYARELAAAVRSGKVPARDLTAATARQLQGLGDPAIDKFVAEVWGVTRTTPKDKADAIERYKRLLTDARLASADAARGRAVYARTCAQCHTLYGEGGNVGPDLTGSNRANLDYVLQNVLDPNAVISNEYRVTLLRTKDGRVMSGIATEGEHAVRMVSETGTVLVPRGEIDRAKRSDLSMMPEGLLTGLPDDAVADLVAYLRGSEQVGDGKAAARPR
jgi:putative heme-binding domain-containing protein